MIRRKINRVPKKFRESLIYRISLESFTLSWYYKIGELYTIGPKFRNRLQVREGALNSPRNYWVTAKRSFLLDITKKFPDVKTVELC